MKKLLGLLGWLGFLLLNSQAATVRFAWTNYLGAADTNWFLVYPVGDVAQADGSFISKGPALRLTPNSSGKVTNTFEVGTYVASNRFLARGIAFRVPDDHGPTVYCATCGTNNTPAGTGLAISGFNYFITITYGTNPPPTYDEITNSLGYLPVSSAQATNIAAYQALLATNGFRVIATNIAAYQAQIATQNLSALGVDVAAGINITVTSNGNLRTIAASTTTSDPNALTNNDTRAVNIKGPNSVTWSFTNKGTAMFENGMIISNRSAPFEIRTADGVVQFRQQYNETGISVSYISGDGGGLTNIGGGTGTFIGTFTGNGAGLTNLPGSIHDLYVAPWGNNATAQRGDPFRPWGKVYDYDGTTRSGVCVVATNGDTIHILGTNRLGHAQFNDGVTVRGYRDSALLFTNQMGFTNNVVFAMSASGDGSPNWPWLARNGNVTFENVYADARNGTMTNASGTGLDFISVFQCNTAPYMGSALYDTAAGVGSSSHLWVLNDTNNLQQYNRQVLFGTTNNPGRTIIRNCHLWGNQDVFYENFTGTIFYYNGSTNDPAYNSTDWDLELGNGWSGIKAAMTWSTNAFRWVQPEVIIEDTILEGYWDHTFISSTRWFGRNNRGYSHGYAGSYGTNNAANFGQGPQVGGLLANFRDIGSTYYCAFGTTASQQHGINVNTATNVVIEGVTFFLTNTAMALTKSTTGGNLGGDFYDGFSGQHYFVGGRQMNLGMVYNGISTNPVTITTNNVVVHVPVTGNASGLTNIQEQALVYPAANPAAGLVLTSTSSNTAAWLAPSGGDPGNQWKTNGNAGLLEGSFLGTLDNLDLQLRSSNATLARFSGYSNHIIMGDGNRILGWQPRSVIGGGSGNLIEGPTNSVAWYINGFNTIAGGQTNTITGAILTAGNTIGGGWSNYINDAINGYNLVGGGADNRIGSASVGLEGGSIAGGVSNWITNGYDNFIGGGSRNIAGGAAPHGKVAISGGNSNTAIGSFSAIPGGNLNFASGSNSFAAGFKANATHPGSVVFSDVSSDSTFPSAANNEFAVRAAGGLRLASGQFVGNGAGLTNLPPPLPMQPQQGIYLKEEFASGTITSGSIGELGWVFDAIGAGGGVSGVSTLYGHPQMGVVRVYSTVSAAGETLSTGTQMNINSATNRSWRVTFVGNTDQTTGVRLYFGLGDGSTALQANGIGFRYDTTLSDTAWMAYVMSGGTQSATTTGVSVNTSAFPRFQIECNSAGTITYFIDGTQVATRTTGGPATTVFLRPQAQILSDGSVTRHWNFDYFAFTEASTR